jgi:outer membrane lipoprotein-sorting protein
MNQNSKYKERSGTMKSIVLSVIVLAVLFSAQASAGELTADEVLKKSDDVANEPKDQDLKMKLILIDKKGKEKERVMTMLQKGSDKRMVKFLSPADQKGIGFLDLPDDVMYLYLPAFKKIRRIASHVKNQKFAGTDFTYDDMGTINYSEDYDAKFIKKTEEHFILELTPEKGKEKDYGKLHFWVRKDNFYPEKIEYYDKDGKLWKVLERSKIEKVSGHWIAKEVQMSDLKDEHKTKMIIQEVKFDTGLKDKLFSERYLKRK